MRARWLFLVVVVALFVAPTASAHDSPAPDGASHNWLPTEDWVYRHWVPFNERELAERLGLGDGDLEAYLINDHRTLADLARHRGLDPATLASELVAGVSDDPGRLHVLEERARRVLTQGHLAQHIFFHAYHGIDLRTDAARTFGLSPDEYYALRKRGLTPRETARRGGRDEADVRSAMATAFAADHSEGLRLGVADRDEQDTLLARRQAQVDCWLGRPLPVLDPGHPYGQRFKLHGRHLQSYPRSTTELVRDAARVEFDLARLKPSCWTPPRPWRGQSPSFRRGVRLELHRLRRRPPRAEVAAAAAASMSAVCRLPVA